MPSANSWRDCSKASSTPINNGWMTALNTMVFRNEDHNTPSPLSEARMMQALYFPELGPELVKVLPIHCAAVEVHR